MIRAKNIAVLAVNGIVIVLVWLHPRHKGTSPVILHEVPQVAQGLHSLLKQHHFIHSALEARDHVTKGTGKVQYDRFDGF